MKFRDYLNEGVQYFPELNDKHDVYDYIEELYNRDTPEKENYLHILKSFKRVPMFLNWKDLKFSSGKSNLDLIATEKSGLKRKFLIEFDRSTGIQVFIQTKPRQRIKDFEFYKSYTYDELY